MLKYLSSIFYFDLIDSRRVKVWWEFLLLTFLLLPVFDLIPMCCSAGNEVIKSTFNSNVLLFFTILISFVFCLLGRSENFILKFSLAFFLGEVLIYPFMVFSFLPEFLSYLLLDQIIPKEKINYIFSDLLLELFIPLYIVFSFLIYAIRLRKRKKAE